MIEGIFGNKMSIVSLDLHFAFLILNFAFKNVVSPELRKAAPIYYPLPSTFLGLVFLLSSSRLA